MKIPFFFIAVTALFFSCSGDEEKKSTDDSIPVKADSVTVVQTDSGRIEIQYSGYAMQYDKDGKLKGSGYFRNNKPEGAWIRYDENGAIVSAEHFSPDGNVLKELDKTDFVFRTWTNKDFGAAFSIPENWEEVPSANPALLVSFTKKVQDDSVMIKPNINVVKAQLKPGDNLDKLAAMQMEILHQNVERVEPPIAEEYFNPGSCKGFRRYGMYYTANNKVGYLNAIIISENNAWFFSCEAQNREQGEFLLYQGVFQQIVDSFKRVK